MVVYESISEGLDSSREYAATNKKTVFALLSFQNTQSKMVKTCFLFKSEADAGAQLIKNYPDYFAVTGVDPKDMGNAIIARQVRINLTLEMNRDNKNLEVYPKGHAEEFLIRNFRHCCKVVGEDIKFVTIYVSHSPCVPDDTNCSNSLNHWPDSCTMKFGKLAKAYAMYHFTVCFFERFGFNSNKDDIESYLKTVSGNLPNLAFVWMK